MSTQPDYSEVPSEVPSEFPGAPYSTDGSLLDADNTLASGMLASSLAYPRFLRRFLEVVDTPDFQFGWNGDAYWLNVYEYNFTLTVASAELYRLRAAIRDHKSIPGRLKLQIYKALDSVSASVRETIDEMQRLESLNSVNQPANQFNSNRLQHWPTESFDVSSQGSGRTVIALVVASVAAMVVSLLWIAGLVLR